MIEPWKKRSEKVDYDCGFFQVNRQESSSPVTGKTHPFYVLSTRPWTNVVALTPEGRMVMVNQFRHGSQGMSLEIPGGAVDPKDPSPLEAARRELKEETGHEALEWVPLGEIHPNPAILDNSCHLFLALGARKVSDLKLDEAEEVEVSLHALAEVREMVRAGRIRHALVVAAFHLLDLYLEKNPGKIS